MQGKFSKWLSCLIVYIRQRFNVLLFIGYSLFLLLFVKNNNSINLQDVYNLAFVFFTLFVFRLQDDLWSAAYDRQHHPTRVYLEENNYRKLLVIAILTTLIYLATLSFYTLVGASVLVVLILVSALLYKTTRTYKAGRVVIPLLKYPVILWILNHFSLDLSTCLVYISSLLIVLSTDLLSESKGDEKNSFLNLELQLISVLLLVQYPNLKIPFLWALAGSAIVAILFFIYRKTPFPTVVFLLLFLTIKLLKTYCT
jgi:hypothetical protein